MNSQTTSHSKIVRFLLVISAILFLSMSGCASYRITIPSSDPTDIQYKEAGMNAYVWGWIKSPPEETANCEQGINDVIVDDNLGYDLISVITLGIWKPISVRYSCKAASSSKPSVTMPSGSNQTENQ